MSNFFAAFAVVFIAEMGDKTQLFLVGLTSKFKLKSIILGVVAAVAVLNGAAVALGYFVGGAVDPSAVKLAAGAAFLAFAYTSLLPKSEDGERVRGRGAAMAVFLSFSLAELGDKTQLTALTLSARSSAEGGGIVDAAVIFIACTAGLIAADAIGVAVGYVLSKKLPERALGMLSFVIFTAFGIWTLAEATDSLTGSNTAAVVAVTASVTVAFASLCAATLIIQKKRNKNEKTKSENDESV